VKNRGIRRYGICSSNQRQAGVLDAVVSRRSCFAAFAARYAVCAGLYIVRRASAFIVGLRPSTNRIMGGDHVAEYKRR
jgi:hypothetical protein